VQEGQPCLSVNDSGRGIPESERPLVFDRFYRGAAAPSAAPAPGRADSLQVNGSGLGLAIVRAVAERHDAAVSLDESPQGGLHVSVRFPANRVSM
jgi:two-component system, OmpR family, sensor kinase